MTACWRDWRRMRWPSWIPYWMACSNRRTNWCAMQRCPRPTAAAARGWPTIAGNHERQLLTQSRERMGASDRFAAECLDEPALRWLAAHGRRAIIRTARVMPKALVLATRDHGATVVLEMAHHKLEIQRALLGQDADAAPALVVVLLGALLDEGRGRIGAHRRGSSSSAARRPEASVSVGSSSRR